VLVIRHAEKPDDDSVHLSPAGQKRAEALHQLFEGTADRPAPFPKPDFIFATKRAAHSNRPVETVTPLANSLGMDIHEDIEDDDYAQLAAKLLMKPKYTGKVVLVCWHHGKIPQLAGKLGVKDAPAPWDPAVFDKVWVITYKDGEAKLTVANQALMPGDKKD
jgi:hypothetical protein